jgi:hypothetical protein
MFPPMLDFLSKSASSSSPLALCPSLRRLVDVVIAVAAAAVGRREAAAPANGATAFVDRAAEAAVLVESVT